MTAAESPSHEPEHDQARNELDEKAAEPEQPAVDDRPELTGPASLPGYRWRVSAALFALIGGFWGLLYTASLTIWGAPNLGRAAFLWALLGLIFVALAAGALAASVLSRKFGRTVAFLGAIAVALVVAGYAQRNFLPQLGTGKLSPIPGGVVHPTEAPGLPGVAPNP
ncbi:MAG: hypothetical protein ACYDAY_03140 [Candidatus Dormibacteria bacterium]